MPTGRSRYEYARGAGIADQAVRLPYEPVVADDIAKDAEDWFLALYGLKQSPIATGPTPCDLIIRNRYGTIAHLDVKSTPYRDGRLIRHKDTQKRTHWCTAYVLVVGQPGSWEIRGWTWGYLLQAAWDESLPKAAWALPQSALRQNIDILMAATFELARLPERGESIP